MEQTTAELFKHGLWFQVYYSSHTFLLYDIRYALLIFITQWPLTALKYMISALKTPVVLAIDQPLELNILLQNCILLSVIQDIVIHTT